MLERKDFTTDFEALVNRAFADFPFFPDFTRPGYATPAFDVYEKDGKYVLDVAVPGYESKDVNVEVNGSTVTVSGWHKETDDKKSARFHRREFRTGSFTRSVTLPQDLDPDKVQAELKKGVLTITLTPYKPIAPKKVAIKGE